MHSRYNFRPLLCNFADTVMDPIDVGGIDSRRVTCIKQDECKAAILTDTGFIHSGQRAGKDKWNTSS